MATDIVSKERKQQALDQARELLTLAAPIDAPVDLDRIAKLQGVTQIVREPMESADAELVPTEDGYVIRVNNRANQGRQRFSIAHEIGHTFYPRQRTAYRNAAVALEPRRTSQLGYRQEERLCDIVAVELLMPRQAFISALSADSPSIEEIETLAGRFDTSVLATASRYAELNGQTLQINRWTIIDGQLRPWTFSGDLIPISGFDFRSPENATESTIANAYASRPIQDGLDRFSTAPHRILIQAKGYGQGDDRYVLSLLTSSAHP